MAFTNITNRAPKLTPTGPGHDLENDHEQGVDTGKAGTIDSIGLGLLIAGIGCMQYVLERGQADEWFESKAILTSTIIAAITLPTFVWWELKTKDPIINLRLFKESVVRNGTALMFMLGFMLFGVMFILPIFMARVLNFDATQTGMMFIPGAILTAFTMPFIGKALQKVDARVLILTGTCIVLCMMLLMTHFSSMTGKEEVFWSLIVRGAGMGFLFVPINAVVLGQFRGQSLGQVSGLMNLLRQIGGSVGIALMDTLLERKTHQNELDLASHVSVLNPGTQMDLLKHGSMNLMNVSSGAMKNVAMRMEQQVYMMSFTQMIWWVFIIYCLSFIPLFLLKPPGKIDPKAAMDAH